MEGPQSSGAMVLIALLGACGGFQLLQCHDRMSVTNGQDIALAAVSQDDNTFLVVFLIRDTQRCFRESLA